MAKKLKGPVLVPLAFASLVTAQQASEGTVNRVLHFTSGRAENAVEEITTVVRAIANIKQFSMDSKENALLLEGTANQIGLAEWLFPLLDEPPSLPGSPQDLVKHEFRMSVNPDDIARVFYLTNAATVQSFQEIATALRSVINLPRMFTYNEPRAIIVRGTTDQVAAAEFLLAEVDKPATESVPYQKFRSSSVHIYRPAGSDGVVKVFYLPYAKTVRDFQLLVTTARTATDLRWMFTYNAARAALARGTAEQVDATEWLLSELDPESQKAGPHVYRYANASDDMMRIFYLAHAATAERLEEIARPARALSHRRIALPYEPAQAIVVRGTNVEIALADRIIRERDQ